MFRSHLSIQERTVVVSPDGSICQTSRSPNQKSSKLPGSKLSASGLLGVIARGSTLTSTFDFWTILARRETILYSGP